LPDSQKTINEFYRSEDEIQYVQIQFSIWPCLTNVRASFEYWLNDLNPVLPNWRQILRQLLGVYPAIHDKTAQEWATSTLRYWQRRGQPSTPYVQAFALAIIGNVYEWSYSDLIDVRRFGEKAQDCMNRVTKAPNDRNPWECLGGYGNTTQEDFSDLIKNATAAVNRGIQKWRSSSGHSQSRQS
jgi:hypothetical protein